MSKTISHRITIKASPDKVFKALSTLEGLRSWYTPHVEGSAGHGKEAAFKFTGREPFRWRFIELVPNSRVRWECVEGPGSASGTTVTFRLSDKGNGRTTLECDHEEWPDEHESLPTCNTFWGILMGHLRDYAENAKGVPAFH